MKGIAEARGIMSLFEGVYSAGEHGTASKVDLVRSPLDEHDIRDAWMVGDRSSDVEAGKENGQTVIGCRYAGFGGEQELKGSDVVIHSFSHLLRLHDRRIDRSRKAVPRVASNSWKQPLRVLILSYGFLTI